METIIFSTLLFFLLILIGYAFYNRKFIFLNLITALMIILLGVSIWVDGLEITYAGAYGFLNVTEAVTGIASTTVSHNGLFENGFGMFLIILGLMILYLTIIYLSRGSVEERDD